jgi:hypothetical protein
VTTAKDKGPKIPKDMQNAIAWAKWRGAAQKFKGIGKQLEARAELRNIRLSGSGYQVVFNHKNNYLSRCFAGSDEASLQRAIRFRDEVLRDRPRRKRSPVPMEVLHALGLSEEVTGIYRLPSRSVYRVEYRGPDGRVALKQFYFRCVPEVDAYAAAISFPRDREAVEAEGESVNLSSAAVIGTRRSVLRAAQR